jgi:hypothetical protein
LPGASECNGGENVDLRSAKCASTRWWNFDSRPVCSSSTCELPDANNGGNAAIHGSDLRYCACLHPVEPCILPSIQGGVGRLPSHFNYGSERTAGLGLACRRWGTTLTNEAFSHH